MPLAYVPLTLHPAKMIRRKSRLDEHNERGKFRTARTRVPACTCFLLRCAVDVAKRRDGSSYEIKGLRSRAAAIPILRGNFPLFRCSVRFRAALSSPPSPCPASFLPEPPHRHRRFRCRRPRVFRLAAFREVCAQIEISLNSPRLHVPPLPPPTHLPSL